VQRAKPFAGEWGVPTKSFLFPLPPQAASEGYSIINELLKWNKTKI
jgi:hypothetical protein